MRFTAKDQTNNVHYLVVKPRIYLTNPSRMPMALSNIVADAARLEFDITDILESEDTDKAQTIIKLLNLRTGFRWTQLLPYKV